MKFLSRASKLRTVFIFGAPLLGVWLAPAMAKHAASNGFVGKKPSVVLQTSKALITYPCPTGAYSSSGSCPTTMDMQVALTSVAKDFNNPTYSYSVAGGRIIGEGSNVTWDLYDAGPGFHRAIVEVLDHKKHRAVSSVDVTVRYCGDCIFHEPCMVPIFVRCYDKVNAGRPATCRVVIGRREEPGPFTFEWSARDSSGNDLADRISRRGEYISIRTDGLGGQSVTATVKVNGLDPSCATTAASSTVVNQLPLNRHSPS